MKRGSTIWIVGVALAAVWTLWTWLLTHGSAFLVSGHSKSIENPYAISGSFGDSFGPIAAFMATVAAISALYAFNNDRREKRIDRFESNFYTLLANFESITQQTYMSVGKVSADVKHKFSYQPLQDAANRQITKEFHGRRALRIILMVIRTRIKPSGYRDIKVVAAAYNLTYDNWVASLGHYFRTLYHIFRLIEESCPNNAMYYARIVRAQLSNDELCLLAYNCIVGEGRFKFKTLLKKYHILHNVHRTGLDAYKEAELNFFERKLHKDSFCFDKIVDITYDD